MQNENFIKSINIKKYKCFNDVEVNGLKRVNLIGGKNNIGKTAFMEACYLLSNGRHYLNSRKGSGLDTSILHFEIIKLLISIKQNRDSVNFLLEWLLEEFELADFGSFSIEASESFRLILEDSKLTIGYFIDVKKGWGNFDTGNIARLKDHNGYNEIYKKNHKPQLNNHTFSSIGNIDGIKDMVDYLKLNEKYDLLNSYLTEIFNIEQVDIIKNKVMLKQNGKFKELSEFGDGTKHFIDILLVLLSHKGTTVYLDEVENGIHYLLFDKLWKIILSISEKQKIQVFATTHSKECIESYCKVSNELAESEVSFINLSTNKNNKTVAIVLDSGMFKSEIEQNHEVRAW